MENIYELLKTPQWWVTVVVAGIFINLLSSYLKNVLDARISGFSNWWQNRSSNKKNEREKYVSKLASDDKFFALNAIRQSVSFQTAIVWITVSVGVFILAILIHKEGVDEFLMFMSSISFFVGFNFLLKSTYYSSCAEDAVDETKNR